MQIKTPELGWIKMGGSPIEIGRALGRAGRDAVHAHLLCAPIWRAVTSAEHVAHVARMFDAVGQQFPNVRAEIEGLADGLDLPVQQVMAWNCRGDLLATVPDGCTTVCLPAETPILAHNEDGLPFFRGSAFMAEVQPDKAPGFRAFCYPGSIPGHTFAVTDAGLVQTVNNMRFTNVDANIPRMVLGRSVLGAATLDAATAILMEHPNSGGFHFALSHARDQRILSVEFGAGEVSIREIAAPSIHANHALHHIYGRGHQIITQSSGDRQTRGEDMIGPETVHPLAILRDQAGRGLPIWRDAADDPDEENTLATAVFRIGIGRIDWSIYDRCSENAAYSGTTTC